MSSGSFRYSRLLATAVAIMATMVSAALAEEVREVVIEPVENEMEYATTEITAEAGTRLRIVMRNTATAKNMRHNVTVLETPPDDQATIQEVGLAGARAADRDFIPEHEAILASTATAAPGETTEVVFTVPPPGDHAYICTYPGHYATMQGTLHSVESME